MLAAQIVEDFHGQPAHRLIAASIRCQHCGTCAGFGHERGHDSCFPLEPLVVENVIIKENRNGVRATVHRCNHYINARAAMGTVRTQQQLRGLLCGLVPADANGIRQV